MNDNPDETNPQQRLRARALAQLTDKKAATRPETATDKLLHELHVHQVELEMQNEELRQAQAALEASRDRYVDLYEFAPIGYLTIDTTGLIAEINLTGVSLLGAERNKLLKHRFAEFVADQDKDRWYQRYHEMTGAAAGEKHSFELLLKRADGTTVNASVDCLRRTDWAGIPVLRIAFVDITQRIQAETQLRIAAIAFESTDGIMVTDANCVILKVNRALTETTGYKAEELVGQTPRVMQSGYHNQAFYDSMWGSLHQTGAWQGEIWDRHKDRTLNPKWLTITAVKNDEGNTIHYVGIQSDITHQNAADEIIQLVFYDALTKLPNRRLLQDRLKQTMVTTGRTGKQGALLFIDLDNFKLLNDTCGHNRGDMLLSEVAGRLLTCIREGDTVARLGGDEFVVMLEDLSGHREEAAAQCQTIGEKILATLDGVYRLDGHEHHSTSSIGVVLFQGQQYSMDELLKRADSAMYQAKESGRNALRFFDPKMQAKLEARAKLEQDLRIALEEKQFKLYYQKQVTHDGQVVGAEVLIRWHHPVHGMVMPLDFIPIAEESLLIIPIGQWVLETACAQLKKWAGQAHAHHLQLAVNVSARQFHQPDFVQQVFDLIGKMAIDPNKLKIELTESVVLDDIADTIAKMNALREFGVLFSMDDFGTGYSSLSYLTQLPLHQLKIDQSFVRNIGIKPSDAAIVQTIIGMTKNLNIEVIAEGVETEQQRVFLEQHGCPLCQGYLFSKPVPLEEFEQLL